ncbi:MAG: hypothetical protein ACLFVA_06055, partial [Dehalococcoidia bacterium]
MQGKWWRSGFFYILLLVVVVGVVLFSSALSGGPEEVTLPDFISRAKGEVEDPEDQIDTIRQVGDTLEGLKGEEVKITTAFEGSTYELRTYLEAEGVNLGAGGIKIDVQASGVDWGMIA